MEKIKNASELKEAIKKLEQKQADEWKALKNQTDISFQSANPLNILKTALSDVITVPEPKQEEKVPDMLTTALSLLAGYGAKKLVVQNSDSAVRNLVGTVVQFGVTNLVANNAHVIKLAAARVVDLVVSENKTLAGFVPKAEEEKG